MSNHVIPKTFSPLPKGHLSKSIIDNRDDLDWQKKISLTNATSTRLITEYEMVSSGIKNSLTAILNSMYPKPPMQIIQSADKVAFSLAYNISPIIYQQSLLSTSTLNPIIAIYLKPNLATITSSFQAADINIITEFNNFHQEVKATYEQFLTTGWSSAIEQQENKIQVNDDFLRKLMATCGVTRESFKAETIKEHSLIHEFLESKGHSPTLQQIKTVLYLRLPLTKINIEETSIKPLHEEIQEMKTKILQFESASIDSKKQLLTELISTYQFLEPYMEKYRSELLKSLLFIKVSKLSLRTNELIHIALYFYLIQQTTYWLDFISWLLKEISGPRT